MMSLTDGGGGKVTTKRCLCAKETCRDNAQLEKENQRKGQAHERRFGDERAVRGLTKEDELVCFLRGGKPIDKPVYNSVVAGRDLLTGGALAKLDKTRWIKKKSGDGSYRRRPGLVSVLFSAWWIAAVGENTDGERECVFEWLLLMCSANKDEGLK